MGDKSENSSLNPRVYFVKPDLAAYVSKSNVPMAILEAEMGKIPVVSKPASPAYATVQNKRVSDR